MKKLFTILTFAFCFQVAAQNNVYTFNAADGTPMKRYDSTFNGWNARILMRQDQNYNTDSNEVFIDVCGLGEVGTDTSKLNDNGYGYWISNARWDGTVTLPSGNHHPIIVVLQPTSAWPSESTTDSRIDAILGRWRIKKRSVHVSGLSMGGWTWTTYVTGDSGSPWTRAKKITSVVESGGVKPDDNTPYPNLFDNFATHGNGDLGGNLLSFQQRLDGRDAETRVARMNSTHAGSFFIETNFGGEGHSNFNDHYNPATTNWTTSYAEVTSTDPSGGLSYSMGQWQLIQGDTTTNWSGAPPPVTANAGADKSYAYSQNGTAVTFTVNGTSSNTVGTVTYLWQKVGSEPSTTTITSSTDSTTTITGANVSGYYQYRLGVTDDGGTRYDTISIWLRDWMQKNVTPCRSGTKQRFTISQETDVYFPYINRDNAFGQTVQGGDTISFESGTYSSIEIGDFGGSPGCPVIVMADSVVNYGGVGKYFRIANKDSNAVVYTHFNGLANRETKGVVYGFQYKNSGSDDENGFAMVGNMVHHIEIDGVSAENVGVGFFFKKNSDSTKLWAYYDKYRLRKLSFHDLYLYNINGEGFYIGHTSINGDPDDQPGNNGYTVQGDSLSFNRIIIDSTNWDGLQTSNSGYGTTIKNILTNRTGRSDASSQQWSTFVGGNMQGSIDSCVSINSTGPLGWLGKGNSSIKNSIIDSVYSTVSSPTADGMYLQMSSTASTLDNPIDSAILTIENCIISRVQRYAINVANNSGHVKKDTLRNNQFVDASKTTAELTNNNVTAKYETGNTVVTSLDLSTSSLSGLPAYRVYKELLRTNAAGTKISFFDLDSEEEPPVILIRQIPITPKRGRRVKF